MNSQVLKIRGKLFGVQARGKAKIIPGGYLLPPGRVVVASPFDPVAYFRHGWHSWSPSWWRREEDEVWLEDVPGHQRPLVDDPAFFSVWPHSSSGIGALEDEEGRIALLGALGIGSRVEFRHNVMWGWSEGDACPWFLGYGLEAEVFQQYVSLLEKHLGKRARSSFAPNVWCSWYGYYRDIDETLLLKVTDGLVGFPIEVFQVDDGWQRDIGTWEPNERFPHGMAYLAEKIKKRGFKPGIWVAPFIVRPTSSLWNKHSGWVLRDNRGEPVIAGINWGGPFYSLDLTHPGVLKWLGELFRVLRSWGYEYFKLDFLYAGALPGVHSFPGGREMIYRNALWVIREALGDAYFLACGAPIMPSLGIVDGIRIGPDVAPWWETHRYDPSTQNAIRCSVHRLWLRPLVHTDPDVVFFRTKYNLLTNAQKKLLQDLAQVAGFKGTSDPPEWLDEREMQEMREFFVEKPPCKRLSRYLYTVGDREVSFAI